MRLVSPIELLDGDFHDSSAPLIHSQAANGSLYFYVIFTQCQRQVQSCSARLKLQEWWF